MMNLNKVKAQVGSFKLSQNEVTPNQFGACWGDPTDIYYRM